jgi:hypothetical protein
LLKLAPTKKVPLQSTNVLIHLIMPMTDERYRFRPSDVVRQACFSYITDVRQSTDLEKKKTAPFCFHPVAHPDTQNGHLTGKATRVARSGCARLGGNKMVQLFS